MPTSETDSRQSGGSSVWKVERKTNPEEVSLEEGEGRPFKRCSLGKVAGRCASVQAEDSPISIDRA